MESFMHSFSKATSAGSFCILATLQESFGFQLLLGGKTAVSYAQSC